MQSREIAGGIRECDIRKIIPPVGGHLTIRQRPRGLGGIAAT
jgi:hypothetical protein